MATTRVANTHSDEKFVLIKQGSRLPEKLMADIQSALNESEASSMPEKKNLPLVAPIPTLLSRTSGKVKGSISLEVVTSATAVYTAGVASGTISWDPTSLADFKSCASLFTEYKVTGISLEIRAPPVTTDVDWTEFAYVADDPASQITASLSSVAQAEANTNFAKMGVCRHKGRPSLALAATSTQPAGGGWLAVSAVWPGRFVYYVQSANVASAASAFAAVVRLRLTFRARV